ncbi:HAMP domain-containing histidine kinase [Oscillospiraceae bacterium CM]|nr:HAMP domain-containing histidine kinase [Oscillospiraceae bacterium CM]
METVAFSIGVFFFMIAINRFGFLGVVPIALQTVVDHISDFYVVINEDREIIDFNKPFVDYFKNIAVIARKDKLEDLLMQVDQLATQKYETFLNFIDEAVKSNKTVSFENQFVSNSFDKIVTVEITPIYSNALYKGTVILFKDITEQKKDAELIAKTQLMLIESEHLVSLGQLVGGIAHNLKTPIMSISGGLEGLSDLIEEYDESIGDDEITPEDHHEIAGEMRAWIGKMKDYTAYMSDVISTVKGQAVQLTASTTDWFTLRELLKRIEILMNHELKRFSCHLRVHCTTDMDQRIKGEVNSLIQVINNLIANSIDAYEGKEGVIEFIIKKVDSMVLFEIRDYASGMTEEVQNKLFKEMITTKAKNGTGLGLYMSYSTITGRYGGKMWFKSVAGQGTSFFVSVPAA